MIELIRNDIVEIVIKILTGLVVSSVFVACCLLVVISGIAIKTRESLIWIKNKWSKV